MKSGVGEVAFGNYDMLQANFANDFICQGPIKLVYSTGEVYQGQSIEGIREGEGKFTYVVSGGEIIIYNGGFVNDKREGKGVLEKSKEFYFSGEFVED